MASPSPVMTALLFDGQTAAVRDDVPRPQPGNGEQLLRIRLAGICRTDLEITRGYMNFRGVMGHEFVADVVDSSGQTTGRRVAGDINCPCGSCPTCRRGLGNHCPHRTVLGIQGRDGIFAEYALLPEANLHDLPENVSDEQAVFIEPLAAAYEILEQTTFDGEESVIVLGDGRLGLLCAAVLRHVAGTLTIVGKHPEKLAWAAGQDIATCSLADFQPNSQADVVVEATGTKEGFTQAMAAVRPRGRILLKSTLAAESGMNLAPLVIDEVTVIGSRCGPFDRAIEALRDGLVDPAGLITARYPLRDGEEAMRAAEEGSHIKIVLDPTDAGA